MTDPWLVLTIGNRFRVKWRDEATMLQDADFDTEHEARAFAARKFGARNLRFLPDMETSMLRAGQLMKATPGMSTEEAMERVGIGTVTYTPKSP